MSELNNIQQEVKRFLTSENLNLTKFSNMTNINKGILSSILNGTPPRIMSLKMLDRITKQMSLPEGHYYSLYVDECFREGIHWRRIKPFFFKCSHIGRLDCICKALKYLLEDLKQIPFIFEVAEEMFEEEAYEAASILYKKVVEAEKSHQSERLGISYYRLFQIYKTDERMKNKAALQFIPYRNQIPHYLALDALLKLANFFALREELEEVRKYADELYELTHNIYKIKTWKNKYFKTERPFTYYYGGSYFLKAVCFELEGDYDQAKVWIKAYQELKWDERLDEKNMKELEKLNIFAQSKMLSLDIQQGNKEYISEYLKILEQNENEILKGITLLLEASNKYNYFFESELKKFKLYLDDKAEFISIEGQYKKEVHFLNYSKLNLQYAIYFFRKQEYSKGISKLLSSLEDSVKSKNQEGVYKTISLYGIYQFYASKRQDAKFKEICKEIWEYNLQTYSLDFN
ncbi:hypothetical protein SK066_02225 [Paenibacillus hunanensis]|uniref:hypothetical protein n=1 Tax=Paenibacillus hunanensis TaxID=539262 RepID=UPI002A6AFED0|nr:hypothetical protein [Paenibacillus hunanensis]WPP41802.1 hypothetical protein SK066_02225 [Paenibacillus hunanensis]